MGRPLSLSVQVPFCERLCDYFACVKEIVPAARRKGRDPAEDLLGGLEAEGLVCVGPDEVRLTEPLGRLPVRSRPGR